MKTHNLETILTANNLIELFASLHPATQQMIIAYSYKYDTRDDLTAAEFVAKITAELQHEMLFFTPNGLRTMIAKFNAVPAPDVYDAIENPFPVFEFIARAHSAIRADLD